MFLRDVGVLDSQRLELLVELVRRVLGTLAGGVRFLRVAISLGRSASALLFASSADLVSFSARTRAS